jgi:lysine-ketoglutarate reductase/saccharopine dehydrogenase-like protein (TIGR00300 family)
MIGRRRDNPTREVVRLEGHIIDSLLLPKVLDLILREQGRFRIVAIEIGQRPADPSWAEIEVEADDERRLDLILQKITPHGAAPTVQQDCELAAADRDGCFPEDFYSTTNLPTEVRVQGRWLAVDELEMDCGVVVDRGTMQARCVPMHRVRVGQEVVVGRRGVRVQPLERRMDDPASFKFMNSAVSSERPKGVSVRDIAECLRQTRSMKQKVLVVGGPAIVHTGAGEHLCRLIRDDYVQVLFAGNALAAHDIEQAFFRTSLGVHLDRGVPLDEGHQHHLRAINRIRRIGGIRQAVEQGVLTSGIMYECVTRGVDFVLAGSIRDDGPLPDVVTDTVEAVERMRALREGVGFCLMIATMLHSVATGNILPAHVRCACVDINPATVTKLADRGTSQSLGIVTDVEPFLRALVLELLGD